jgi:hypothetical protein
VAAAASTQSNPVLHLCLSPGPTIQIQHLWTGLCVATQDHRSPVPPPVASSHDTYLGVRSSSGHITHITHIFMSQHSCHSASHTLTRHHSISLITHLGFFSSCSSSSTSASTPSTPPACDVNHHHNRGHTSSQTYNPS